MAGTTQSSEGTTEGVDPQGQRPENVADRTQAQPAAVRLGEEHPTDDPAVVRTERRHVSAAPAESTHVIARTELRKRYGGLYWGSDFIGFAVANFFTVVFLGIVGAAAGGVGYQMGAPLPKIGHPLTATSQTLGVGAAIASLVGLFLAYLIGGYTAGRMARFDGAKNGLGVVLWTVIVAVLLGIAGAVIGSRFNLAQQVHLQVNSASFHTAGLAAIAIALVVTLLGSALGGTLGERFHRRIDRDAGVSA